MFQYFPSIFMQTNFVIRKKKYFKKTPYTPPPKKYKEIKSWDFPLGDSDAQGSLACCSSWGHKESNTT